MPIVTFIHVVLPGSPFEVLVEAPKPPEPTQGPVEPPSSPMSHLNIEKHWRIAAPNTVSVSI